MGPVVNQVTQHADVAVGALTNITLGGALISTMPSAEGAPVWQLVGLVLSGLLSGAPVLLKWYLNRDRRGDAARLRTTALLKRKRAADLRTAGLLEEARKVEDEADKCEAAAAEAEAESKGE
jgi:hypothetical protein